MPTLISWELFALFLWISMKLFKKFQIHISVVMTDVLWRTLCDYQLQICNQHINGSVDDRPVEFAMTCQEADNSLMLALGVQQISILIEN
jgi:hypothetical protein